MVGTPLLEKVNRFRGFLVLEFLGVRFLVVGFLGSFVPWFQSFKDSKIQKIDCFHITKIPFHVLTKILIPYSRFSRNYWTDRRYCSVPVFSKLSKNKFLRL